MPIGGSTRVLLGRHPTFVFEWRETHAARGKSERFDVYAVIRTPERP